jgi:hypothetical protein
MNIALCCSAIIGLLIFGTVTSSNGQQLPTEVRLSCATPVTPIYSSQVSQTMSPGDASNVPVKIRFKLLNTCDTDLKVFTGTGVGGGLGPDTERLTIPRGVTLYLDILVKAPDSIAVIPTPSVIGGWWFLSVLP